MGYTYSQLVDALAVETRIPASSTGFLAILPTVIAQAEGMIYREDGMQFLSTIVTNSAGFTTPNSRSFSLPVFFAVLHSINAVVGNDRTPLIKISREAIDFLYPHRIATDITAVPTRWAPDTDQTVLLGPVPGGMTQLECVGETPPTTLSAINPSTWLWTNLGDFAFAAAMYFFSGYMRNFGVQADDPKMAQSWKSVYDALLPGAKSEENRRKFQASGGS